MLSRWLAIVAAIAAALAIGIAIGRHEWSGLFWTAIGVAVLVGGISWSVRKRPNAPG
jgi:hypothetical protein